MFLNLKKRFFIDLNTTNGRFHKQGQHYYVTDILFQFLNTNRKVIIF